MTNQIIQGDCLVEMKKIEDKSIDMVLCDLPYNTTACHWDKLIPFEPLWEQYKRIIKDNGAIVLTASQPFTSALVMSNIKYFKYSLVWDKKFGIPAHAKIRPMKTHEDINIFCYGKTPYNPQMIKRDKPIKSGGNKCNSVTSPLSRIDGWKKTYDYKFPISILNYPREIGRTVHPTQKPVALGRYLIRTYTNEGDLILDNTCGSGSFLVSAMLEKRNFIGIELDENYCAIARKRLEDTQKDIDSKLSF